MSHYDSQNNILLISEKMTMTHSLKEIARVTH